MSNFLEDYIRHRGEDTVVRTIYGILDRTTGEHLVPVRHADQYFDDSIEIGSKPNQGYVDFLDLSLSKDLPAESVFQYQEDAVLSISVNGGTPPISYEWFKDESPLAYTTRTINLGAADSDLSGTYSCVVTDGTGAEVDTSDTTVKIKPPKITFSDVKVNDNPVSSETTLTIPDDADFVITGTINGVMSDAAVTNLEIFADSDSYTLGVVTTFTSTSFTITVAHATVEATPGTPFTFNIVGKQYRASDDISGDMSSSEDFRLIMAS